MLKKKEKYLLAKFSGGKLVYFKKPLFESGSVVLTEDIKEAHIFTELKYAVGMMDNYLKGGYKLIKLKKGML